MSNYTEKELYLELQKSAFNAANILYKPGRNFIYSPASLTFALGMLLEGADGQSRKEIGTLLFGSKFGQEEESAEKSSEYLSQLFHGDPEGVLKLLRISNFFYGHKNMKFEESFVTTLREKYKATARVFDFVDRKAEAVKIINNDAEMATDGMISELINDIRANTSLILVNAIYFKGQWEEPFNKENTTDKPFHLSNGQIINVPTMERQDANILVNHLSTSNDWFLKLPYETKDSQDDEQIYMVIILPGSGNLKQYLSTFDVDKFDESINGLYSDFAEIVSIPRFKIESSHELIPTMKQLGVSKIFTDKADFSKISSCQTKVSVVVQKAVIEVDETGTIASASTRITVVYYSSTISREPFVFRVDRPFVYVLVSENNNRQRQILFLGAVENPLQ